MKEGFLCTVEVSVTTCPVLIDYIPVMVSGDTIGQCVQESAGGKYVVYILQDSSFIQPAGIQKPSSQVLLSFWGVWTGVEAVWGKKMQPTDFLDGFIVKESVPKNTSGKRSQDLPNYESQPVICLSQDYIPTHLTGAALNLHPDSRRWITYVQRIWEKSEPPVIYVKERISETQVGDREVAHEVSSMELILGSNDYLSTLYLCT